MDTSEKTEGKIIQSASQIFLEKGRDGARMQEIADLAGINKALLHYYFRSKDKLYQEVFGRELRKFFANIMESVAETEDFGKFLQNFVNHYISTVSKNKQLIRFFMWEIEKGGATIGLTIKEILLQNAPGELIFVEKIQVAIRQGQIRKVDPVNFIVSLIGMCLFPFIAKPIIENIFTGLDVTSKEFVEKRKQEILQLVWAGIKPE